MNDTKQHCCPHLCCHPPTAEEAGDQLPRGHPGTCQHQSQGGANHHGASRGSDHSDVMTRGGGNEALSLLTVKAWRHSFCHDHLPVPSVPWRSGRGAALSPEQVEDGVSQGIPSTCSATIWPLKQTSACKTIQLQVIKRINLVMLQSEGEHVIHYSSIRGLIRTWLIRVHHCLKLSTKKMF